MTVVLKPGARFRSVTCTTEVVVVKGAGDVDLRCGGEPMVDAGGDAPQSSAPVAPFDEGTEIGKRYVDDAAGIELLASKAGAGSLAVGDTRLELKGAKPLPSSD